jgi:Protein of unknown function (DUF2892)
MKHNIGSIDSTLRIILGVFLLSLIVWGPHSLWGLVGIIPLATGFVRSCPLYTAMNITTDKPAGKTGK